MNHIVPFFLVSASARCRSLWRCSSICNPWQGCSLASGIGLGEEKSDCVHVADPGEVIPAAHQWSGRGEAAAHAYACGRGHP